MTDTPQSPAPAQVGDAERLERVRHTVKEWREWMPRTKGEREDRSEFLLRLLDARDARIAALTEECKAAKGLMRLSDEMHRSAEDELKTVIAALQKAGSQFRWYEQLHAEKGALDKAATNRAMAEMCEAAAPASPERTP